MSPERRSETPRLGPLASYILWEPHEAAKAAADPSGVASESHTEAELLRGLARALSARHSLELGGEPLLASFLRALQKMGAILWLPCGDQLTVGASAVASGAVPDSFRAAFRRQHPRRPAGITGLAWVRGETCFYFGQQRGSYGAEGDPDLVSGVRASIAIPALVEEQVVAVATLYGAAPEARLQRMNCLRETVPVLLGSLVARWTSLVAPTPLTRRERELLSLASTGRTTREIAGELTLSPWTVKTHFENIRCKLHVSDRTAAVAYALRNGMIG